MRRTAAIAIDRKRSPWAPLAWRWLVLVALVLDVLTAPLHAHSHELAPDTSQAALHDAGLPHDESAVDANDDHDQPASGTRHRAHHAAVGHSVTPLRLSGTSHATDATLACIVDHARTLTAATLDQPRVTAACRAVPERVPLPDSRYWPPAGRAPPAVHR